MQVSENPKSNVAWSAKIAAFVTWVKTHLTGDEKVRRKSIWIVCFRRLAGRD